MELGMHFFFTVCISNVFAEKKEFVYAFCLSHFTALAFTFHLKSFEVCFLKLVEEVGCLVAEPDHLFPVTS